MKLNLLTAFTIITCIAASPQHKSKLEMSKECAEKTNANVSATNTMTAKQRHLYISKNKEMKCYSRCMDLKNRAINEAGELASRMLKYFSKIGHDISKIKKCQNNSADDPCERHYNTVQCVSKLSQQNSTSIKCAMETKADLSVFQNKEKHVELIHKNREIKCYFRCMNAKQGKITELGDLNINYFYKYYKYDMLINNLMECTSSNVDPCEKNFEIEQCIENFMYKLKKETTTKKSLNLDKWKLF